MEQQESANWSLLTTCPNTEATVAKKLADHDCEHRLFRVHATKVRRGRVVDAAKPAFPSYIFVQPTSEQVGKIAEISGVVDFVRFGQEIAHLPESEIGQLEARLDARGLLPVEIPCPFRYGERVIVRGNGLIAGHVGIFRRQLSTEMALIDQEWLGRWVEVPIHLEDLDRIQKSAKSRRRRKRKRH